MNEQPIEKRAGLTNEDVEGHRVSRLEGDEDVEGHKVRNLADDDVDDVTGHKRASGLVADEDVEGHGIDGVGGRPARPGDKPGGRGVSSGRFRPDEDTMFGDDVEGHRVSRVDGDDDDVEGHRVSR